MQAFVESIIFLFLISCILLPLALPLAIWWRPRSAGLRAVILTIGLVVPFLVFLLSTTVADPNWKGDCPHGWLDCFLQGKMWLTPLVLWASAAWWSLERRPHPTQTTPSAWITLGIFHGAVVSFVCLLAGILTIGVGRNRICLFLLVPLLVATTYSIRAVQLMRAAKLTPAAYLRSLLVAAPCWIASIIWAKRIYDALPDTRPEGCFVVTAASRGHPGFVGPFTEIRHRGRRRRANRQLVTFWQFEERWQRQAPASHAAFRQIYNRVGPRLARHLTRRWLADLAWLALKPAELLARLATRNVG